jgi:rhodanese-related sulfurtransferase
MAKVHPTELEALMETATVVDVRSPAEYEAAHIPGSFNLPLDRLPACAQDIESAADGPVVLVCRSGQRAEAAQRELQGADLCDLRVLQGGLGAWEAAGLPVNRGRQRWSMERQVRGAAGALVLAGLLASLKFRPAALVSMAVGGGLLFSAVSDTCAMAKVLGKLPYNQGAGCDVDAVLREMSARRQTMTAAAD